MSELDENGDLIIVPGQIYEDCSFHPCLCVETRDGMVYGISLIDGSEPRSCDLRHCGVRILSIDEAIAIKRRGPDDPEVRADYPRAQRWWR